MNGTPQDASRRSRIIGATTVAGTELLGASLSTRPGSPQFYALTLATAGAWVAGAQAASRAGPVEASRRTGEDRSVLGPALVGVGAFTAFYGAALVARHVPVLDRAITEVFKYDRQGSSPLLLFTTLVNGAAEEAFFRGALYEEFTEARAVLGSTAVYVAVVAGSARNPALALAAGVMGAVFAVQRRTTGGTRASTITHLTWSTLMLRHLPALFRPDGRSAR